jgi:DNA polymerase I
MMDAHPHHLIEGLEADDVMGILATTDKYSDRAVIVSIDKDMRTIPGRHLNPAKDTRIVTVTPDEADYAWMTQTLVGDSSDGYKGCPGVGPVGAYKILPALGRRSEGEWLKRAWPLVVSAFAGKKLSEDDALMQARMARILRRSDYDKTTKEVILWHPTTPTRIGL